MPNFTRTLAFITVNLKLFPIFLIFLISCTERTEITEGVSNNLELDSSYWKAESIVINTDTINLELDHLYYRISDTVSGQWSYLNDTITNIVPEGSCLHWTVWSDTIIFGVPCSNFQYNVVKPCVLIDQNHAYTEYVRVFVSLENQYYLKNARILLVRSPIPKSVSDNIHSIFANSPDTSIVVN